MHDAIAFGVLHATGLLIIAFFVAFAAARSGGLLKVLGTVLALWLIVLAAASIWFAVTHKGGHMHGYTEGPANPAAENAPAAAMNAAP